MDQEISDAIQDTYPQTVDEAAQIILRTLSEKSIQYLKSLDEDERFEFLYYSRNLIRWFYSHWYECESFLRDCFQTIKRMQGLPPIEDWFPIHHFDPVAEVVNRRILELVDEMNGVKKCG